MRRQDGVPTVKSAKAWCMARHGRLPRLGHEMRVVEYIAPCPHHEAIASPHKCALQFSHLNRHEIFLENCAGKYKVVHYVSVWGTEY